MWSKVKNWFSGLFKKEEVVELPKEIQLPVEEVESPLNKKAREVLALSITDLVRQVVEQKKPCEHNTRKLKGQLWVHVAGKKFELHNEMVCIKCKDSVIQPIK